MPPPRCFRANDAAYAAAPPPTIYERSYAMPMPPYTRERLRADAPCFRAPMASPFALILPPIFRHYACFAAALTLINDAAGSAGHASSAIGLLPRCLIRFLTCCLMRHATPPPRAADGDIGAADYAATFYAIIDAMRAAIADTPAAASDATLAALAALIRRLR